jgi:hypothetical protein
MKNTRANLQDLLWRTVFWIGMATGCAMAILGVYIRIRSVIPQGALSAWFGLSYLSSAGMKTSHIGWALVLQGLFWIGALIALGVKNRWGNWSVPCASVIMLAFFPGGTLAGVLAILVAVPMILRRLGRLPAGNPEGV